MCRGLVICMLSHGECLIRTAPVTSCSNQKLLETIKLVGGKHSRGCNWSADQQPAVLCPDWDQGVDLRVELSGGATGGPWYKDEIVFVWHCV